MGDYKIYEKVELESDDGSCVLVVGQNGGGGDGGDACACVLEMMVESGACACVLETVVVESGAYACVHEMVGESGVGACVLEMVVGESGVCRDSCEVMLMEGKHGLLQMANRRILWPKQEKMNLRQVGIPYFPNFTSIGF
ncbi:hypothetical protein Lal_00031318 [Lupinus albus]|nr:hypothetical protein Lal_00031318 [Lupinus albus]